MSLNNDFLRRSNKAGNLAQLGGIETSVLDDGLARGTRIAWVNTGSGLRYKVVIDRGLDIADAFYNQYSLAWLSHAGVTAPRQDANREWVWLESFTGGLVTTCGLTHIGAPEADDSGHRGLHGRISNIPAKIESVVLPDIKAGKMEMSISGTMTETSVFGPSIQLKRRISSVLGQSRICIHDEVTNIGNEKCPHMILYHCNFGFPLVDDGSDLFYRGRCESRGLPADDLIFKSRHNCKKCCPVLPSHSGKGEAGAFVYPQPDRHGMCSAGIANSKLNLALELRFPKKQLPCMSNWQHWSKWEYVTAFSPATHYPIGRNLAAKEKKLIYLRPGETREYDLHLEVVSTKSGIQKLLKHSK